MNNLIEVEIENKSFIQLLDLEHQQTNILKLTTLEDNQAAVNIKIFLNKSDTRIPIKEFNIRNLKPKASGIPRFELSSSFNNKILNLELKVDGRKVENTEIKLASYLRNKLLPLYILLGLLAVFLIFTGGKWLFSEFIFNEAATTVKMNKAEDIKTEKATEKQTLALTTIKTEIVTEKPAPAEVKVIELVKEKETSQYTAYFIPNNTIIQKDAAIILKSLAKDLKSKPNAEVEISGYCAMTGTEEGRERLSKERAYNVLNYLTEEGWEPETAPDIKWYGGEKPVTYDKNEIYRNRRVEIKVVLP